MMRGWRSLLPIIVFTALYAVVSLSVTNSYYQLVMTLVPVWALFVTFNEIVHVVVQGSVERLIPLPPEMLVTVPLPAAEA